MRHEDDYVGIRFREARNVLSPALSLYGPMKMGLVHPYVPALGWAGVVCDEAKER